MAAEVTANSSGLADSSVFTRALGLVNNYVSNRSNSLMGVGGWKADLIQPLTVDLMTGQGACGSFSVVLTRLLNELGYEARIVQMKVGNVFGGHILVEAKHTRGWAVLDPSYNLHFIRPDGEMASFDDVSLNWKFYTSQLPAGYDLNYRYEDKRYTNWEKLPVLLPAVKKLMALTLGSQTANTFSLRVLALRKFQLLFYITFFIQLSLIVYMVRYTRSKARKSAPAQALPIKLNEPENKGRVSIIKAAQRKPVSEKNHRVQ